MNNNFVEYFYNHNIILNSSFNFTIIFLNSRSILNKIEKIEDILNNCNCTIDILVVAETWLLPGEERFCNIQNYNGFHSIRHSVNRGGGVSIFLHHNLNGHIIFENSDNFNNFLLIEIPTMNMKIFGIYRSPNYLNCARVFIDKLNQITERFSNCILAGDLNINLLDQLNEEVSLYINSLNANSFHILNSISCDMPTRTSDSSSTIIDHFATDLLQYNYKLSIFENSLSDHNILALQLSIPSAHRINNNLTISIVNKEKVLEEFNSFNFVDNVSCSEFCEKWCQLVHNNTNIKIIKKKNVLIKPFMTPYLLRLSREKERLFSLKKRYPTNQLIARLYKTTRNSFDKERKEAKRNYIVEQHNLNVYNPKNLWKIINFSLYNRNTSSAPIDKIIIDDVLITDKQLIIDNINQHFIHCADSIPNTLNDACTDLHLDMLFDDIQFNFSRVSAETVKEHIMSLKNNVACGYDDMTISQLKNLNSEKLQTLTNIYNGIIVNGNIPKSLKLAKVIPLHKSGDKTVLNNYRGISVLPVMSKPLEKIMFIQIWEHLKKHNLLNDNQFGFVPHSSTCSATLEVLNIIQNSISKKSYTAIIAIDLQKAFDCINHELALRKMKDKHFSNESINVMNSYLSNRYQFVKMGQLSSSHRLVKRGVPQGSILGPLIFIIYVDDIFNIGLKGILILYADDAILIYSEETLALLFESMQHDIFKLKEFFTKHCMKMNLQKTKYMVFKTIVPNHYKLTIDSQIIEEVYNLKYLGLYLEKNLKWNLQVNHIKSKIIPYIAAMYRQRLILPKATLFKIYFAHVHAHLVYLNSIWSNIPAYLMHELKVLQNKALKAVNNLPLLTPTSVLYDKKILPLEKLKAFELATLVYKIIHNNMKTGIVLLRNSDFHSYRTRQYDDLALHNFSPTTILYEGIRSYTLLPDTIKAANSLTIFKMELKKYLMS